MESLSRDKRFKMDGVTPQRIALEMDGVTLQKKVLQNDWSYSLKKSYKMSLSGKSAPNGWNHSPEKSVPKQMDKLTREKRSKMDEVTHQTKMLPKGLSKEKHSKMDGVTFLTKAVQNGLYREKCSEMNGVTLQRKELQNGWSHFPETSALKRIESVSGISAPKWMESLSRAKCSKIDGLSL